MVNKKRKTRMQQLKQSILSQEDQVYSQRKRYQNWLFFFFAWGEYVMCDIIMSTKAFSY